MKKRHSEVQIIQILREGEQADNIRDVCRQHGISEQTLYRWRNKFGDLRITEAHRLKQLEKENARLRRLLADKEPPIDAMKAVLEKVVTAVGRRKVAAS